MSASCSTPARSTSRRVRCGTATACSSATTSSSEVWILDVFAPTADDGPRAMAELMRQPQTGGSPSTSAARSPTSCCSTRASGTVVVDKTLTTPGGAARRRAPGVATLLDKAGVQPSDITAPIVHATTLITNALIEGKTGRAGLVTTDGFGDTLLIRDEHRYDMYDLQIEFPAPPIPRDRIVRDRRAGDRRRFDVLDQAQRRRARCAVTPSCAAAKVESVGGVPPQRLRQPRQRAHRRRPPARASSACRCASPPRSRRRSASTRA